MEVDEAGKVGARLQRIIIFLSAMACCMLLTFNPLVIFGVFCTLMVYASGVHGAQKRKTGHLLFFGVVTLLDVILSILMTAFLIAFVMIASNQHYHQEQSVQTTQQPKMWYHPTDSMIKPLRDYNMIQPVAKPIVKFHLKPVQMSANTQIVEAPQRDGQAVVFKVQSNPRYEMSDETQRELLQVSEQFQQEHLQKRQAERKQRHHRRHHNTQLDDDDAQEEPEEAQRHQITGFGVVMVCLGFILSVIIMSLKVRAVRLAFQMRRMLFQMRRQQLPTTLRTAAPSRPTTAFPGVKPPAGPAPSRRRACERCTYVNVPGSQRCAMCDSSLPFAAAPTSAPNAAPRVYVPGQLYPLNQPLN